MSFLKMSNKYPTKRPVWKPSRYKVPPPPPKPADWEELYDKFSTIAFITNMIMLILIFIRTPEFEPYASYVVAFMWLCYSFCFTLPYLKIVTWPVAIVPAAFLVIFDFDMLLALMLDETYSIPAIWITIFVGAYAFGGFMLHGTVMPFLQRMRIIS